ncbi:cytochrome p450 monooxygenase [Mariannaea sp. PMI_226]|nr:cytochrome p450 monooxygenase [Mariannaea sp. PMI_226]
MLREISLVLAGVVILAYSIEFLFIWFDDPREPRRIAPRIPIIGHLIGFLQDGFDYYNFTSKSTNAEIYTIGILNFKLYITHATRLTHLAQKSKTLSFAPLIENGTKLHGNVSEETSALFDQHVVEHLRLRTKEVLSPGHHLDAQNLRMADESLLQVDKMLEKDQVDLFAWASHAIVQATGAGLYGVGHPFRDPEVENALWIWDDHRPGHMVGWDPLRKGYKAQAKVFQAFRKYFQNMPDDVSSLVRERQNIFRRHGICEKDISQMQSTLSDAAFPNTVPTMFWTVYEIFSRPQLLGVIREEVMSKAVRKSPDGHSFTLDVTATKTQCPILLSTFQETQRVRHSQVAWRMVTEDTLLDGQYLLKKGNFLQMPAKPIHHASKIWGSEANAFDPYRFLPPGAGDTRTKISPSSFLPWGSPPHMCPARQFASTEILIITALLVVRADLTPTSDKGWEREPALKSMELPTLPRPKKDVHLKITRREDATGRWAVVVGESKTRVPLASG